LEREGPVDPSDESLGGLGNRILDLKDEVERLKNSLSDDLMLLRYAVDDLKAEIERLSRQVRSG
jgi:hypothetical protein